MARQINLASLDIAQAITTPYLSGIDVLAESPHKGRLFAMFRPPDRRLESYFHAAKDVTSRYYDATLEEVTLEQYANWPTDRKEFNFMIKSLVSTGDSLIPTDQLTPDDLRLAKAIVKEKMLALSWNDRLGSWAKLMSWLEWTTTQDQRACADEVLLKEWPTQDAGPLEEDDPILVRLMQRSAWDVQLHDFAMHLYQHQTES
eukprot:CAMPEP_0116833120 /NCGR_PEP_ID=MMETSP0418-20121206/6262_1 /TAXON_ID=1158023 /ORGANISM="Astrosyne radiata, Strain 13vi08-1A" /LENGTH=201 /DNA_ID=CAMNT_0004462539 /DNA_START=217 /DNA_END=818 /DNA_ORIENTATION=-